MATLDQLPPDKRAIIELVLQQGKSYEDLGDMLGMSEGRVRELAREALGDLAPATAARVDPDWRGQLADYLLGQQTGPESRATRGHLKRSEPARAWALSLMDSLDNLYGNGSRPRIPEAAPAEEPRRRRERPPEPRHKADRAEEDEDGGRGLAQVSPEVARRRRLIAAAGAVAVLVLVAVLVWPIGILTGDDEEPPQRADRGRNAQPRIVSQAVLRRTSGAPRDAAGVAVVADQNGERRLLVQATGLEANSTRSGGRPGDAYEVWLYNSQRDAKSIGAQVTDREGNYQGAGPLPEDYERYRYVDVSKEPIDENTGHAGESVLRGSLRAGSPQQTQTQPQP